MIYLTKSPCPCGGLSREARGEVVELKSVYRRAVCLFAATGVAAGLVALSGADPAAAVTCPTVSSAGAVSPAPAPGVDWSGCDLAGADMAGANLDDANLNGADLTSATLTSAVLTYVKLENAELSGADLESANLDNALVTYADLAGANLSRISFPAGYLEVDNLSGANLSFADLGTPNVDDLTLTGANLSATIMGYNGDLSGVVSGGIIGTPADLPTYPARWLLAGGYLLGPGAVLANADLAGLDLAGAALYNADLTNADLVGANLDEAQFSGSTLSGTQLSGANLDGVESGDITGTPASLPANWQLRAGFLLGPDVYLINTSLAGDDLSDLDLAGAYTYYANLTGADVDGTNLAGATLNTGTNLTGATFVGADVANVTWDDVTCPDGTNSDQYIDGCFSKLDTTRPVMKVTGVRNGHVYAVGKVPKIGCADSDEYSTIVNPGTLTVSGKGSHGLGVFTATCSGAADLAGNTALPVHATYKVAYGFSGFEYPQPGSTVARSSRVIYVVFGLQGASGRSITRPVGAALARARDVRATLRGPAIKAVTAVCSWHSPGRYFRCALSIPRGVRAGHSRRYTITADENPGAGVGLVAAPGEPTAVDPEIIHFSA
jgi:uncharacterized protein YjbI with pentapeptide repeats